MQFIHTEIKASFDWNWSKSVFVEGIIPVPSQFFSLTFAIDFHVSYSFGFFYS